MDVKPQRPARARSTRTRQDENQVILQAKSTNLKVDKVDPLLKGLKADPLQKGLRAAASRKVFGDVSNKAQKGSDENTKPEKKITAISKPAQRVAGLKNISSNGVVNGGTRTQQTGISQAGPRRITRRTAVYEDKRPSPKRAVSPKVFRNAVTKKEAQGFRSKRNALPSRLSRSKDSAMYSDQQPHLFDKNNVEDDYEDVDADEDVSDGEEDEKHDDNATEVEVMSEDESEDNDTDYTTTRTTRSRGGDNTTGVTTQPILPKWNNEAFAEVEALKGQFDFVDEDDSADISMVAEYGDEIFGYMRMLEQKLLPNAHYMDYQSEIQWSMRAILMDWLVQVHARFNLLPETMFLCTNYIDRFLSNKVVSLGKLQLVGATALFVAAKYEEINCPSVGEIVYMVDKAYSVEEILKAERYMLHLLQFELGWPGPMSFLRRISKADDYDLESRTLAKYFLEITIMDERFVASPPSFLAAGAHCLSRHMLKKGDWTKAHVHYSGYTQKQLDPLMTTLVECCENPEEHHNAIFEKYADRRYKRASVYVKNWMKQEAELYGNIGK